MSSSLRSQAAAAAAELSRERRVLQVVAGETHSAGMWVLDRILPERGRGPSASR